METIFLFSNEVEFTLEDINAQLALDPPNFQRQMSSELDSPHPVQRRRRYRLRTVKPKSSSLRVSLIGVAAAVGATYFVGRVFSKQKSKSGDGDGPVATQTKRNTRRNSTARNKGVGSKGVMWFEELTGVVHETPGAVKASLDVQGDRLISRVNGREMVAGTLSTPSLKEMRKCLPNPQAGGRLQASQIVGDAKELHADPKNAGAIFQVASQFNLLEMAGPHITPEMGVERYVYDATQGPACAVACAAGTIFRNYFVPLNGQFGQTVDHQIDCLGDLGRDLGQTDKMSQEIYKMKNGYALPTAKGLKNVAKRLERCDEDARDRLRGLLRVGIQAGTEVTLVPPPGHLVTQVYCSALPVAYGRLPKALWKPFAELVLEAAYEATLCVAAISGGNRPVFLTLLGGGAFGNERSWVISALARALRKFKAFPMDIRVVSYGRSCPDVDTAIAAALRD